MQNTLNVIIVNYSKISLQTTKSIRCFGEARLDRHRLAPSDDQLHAVAIGDYGGSGGVGKG